MSKLRVRTQLVWTIISVSTRSFEPAFVSKTCSNRPVILPAPAIYQNATTKRQAAAERKVAPCSLLVSTGQPGVQLARPHKATADCLRRLTGSG